MIPAGTQVIRSSIREQVYFQLQEWIVNGILPPGYQLKDKELAEELGISRTPIREALLRLEEEGLVLTKTNRWTQVSPVDINDAYRIYPMIWSLEKVAFTFAHSKISGSEIEKLEELTENLYEALKSENAIDAQKADKEFHQMYINLSGNQELVRVLEGLKTKLQRIEVHYFNGFLVAEQSVEEHKQIINAIKSNNIGMAAHYIEMNWKESLKRVLAQFGVDDEANIQKLLELT